MAVEILVIDSGSTDSSVQIAKSYAVKVISIKPSEFNHGLTRNLGAQLASGDLLLYTVQDAFFSDSDILERMSIHFSNIDNCAVVGHQAVPHEKDKNPLLWYRRFTSPVTKILSFDSSKIIPKAIPWDNVISMYRKSSLLVHPFKLTDTCEDWIWATEVFYKGWKLVYDPSIVIYHYHHRTFLYTLKTEYGVIYTLSKYLNLYPEWPGWFLKNIKAMYHLFSHKGLTFSEKYYWIVHNISSNTSHCLAYLIFVILDNFNKNSLNESLYNRLCNSVPQGKQNTSWN
jgi:rhamnosyltransferase